MLIASDEKKRQDKKKSSKKWSRKFNRPIYHSGSEDSDSDDGERLPHAKAIRRYRDDGLEEYYLERIE